MNIINHIFTSINNTLEMPINLLYINTALKLLAEYLASLNVPFLHRLFALSSYFANFANKLNLNKVIQAFILLYI